MLLNDWRDSMASTEMHLLVDVYAVKRQCDCGGEMESTGLMLSVDPPLYPHRCSECNATENFKQAYPYQILKPRS